MATQAELIKDVPVRHYNGNPNRQQFRKKFLKPSLTKQEFKEECDINHIVRQYDRKGIVTHLNSTQPSYGYAPATDLREALDLITETRANFQLLPADIRRACENNPENFPAYATDPANAKTLVELGLADAPPPDVQKVEVTPNPPESPAEGDAQE